MGGRKALSLAKYTRAIRDSPREIYNRNLFLSVCSFALGGCAKGWDEGAASAISQLPAFKNTCQLDDNTISNLVSFVNLGAGVGAILSFLLNDRIGRVWSLRTYQLVYIAGSLISCLSYGHVIALYVGRIVAGLGIGALSVVAPMAIAELAPKATRGLMTMWFSVCMLSGQMLGIFTVYGCSIHISGEKNLQYQIPWFVQTFAPAISCTISLFIVESPRWLVLRNKRDTALTALARLRGLPSYDQYLLDEYQSMTSETEDNESNSSWQVFKETFIISSNLRRLQLTIIAYILAQMSGANSITNYLPTIFGIVGVAGSNVKLYTTGLYALTKLVCCIAASLVLVDLAGRRLSLMLGVSIQIICHSYLAGYLNIYVQDSSSVTKDASDAAIAMIFFHALGWAIGLYSLPYLFGAELWPNRIRSFGGAVSQCFHWFFYFAITKATPSLLSGLHQWGAFVLFDIFCLLAFVYTYFFVPETTGLGLEEINALFERPLYMLGRPLDTRRENPQSDEKPGSVWVERV